MMSEDEFEVIHNQLIEEIRHVDRGDTPKHAQAGVLAWLLNLALR